jgi:hypothetical protein
VRTEPLDTHIARASFKESTHAFVFRPPKAVRALVYEIALTDPPCMVPRTSAGERRVVQEMASSDIVFLGEHHDSLQDHQLQAEYDVHGSLKAVC